jgi:hypothetical protein
VRAETRALLTWVADGPRTYPEALDVWRTTCPQHSVWEDALADRLLEVVRNGSQAYVVVTDRGRAELAGS